MTHQLIYSSLSAIPMQRDELQALLDHAQRANSAKNITGVLVYVDGHFLQVLEGERLVVEALLERISRDVRHEAVSLLQASEIAVPMFSKWDMAFVAATPEQVAQWVGFSSKARPAELFEDMRRDRQSAMQVVRQILTVLSGETDSRER